MVPQTGLRSAGVLIPVVGPSGAGKDALIALARRAYAGNRWVVFAQRVVTRDADPEAEAHSTASEREFATLEAAGAFAVSWRAHGHAYGIPAAIDEDLGSGRVVVVNVSRDVVAPLRRRYQRVHVVHVTAGPEVLAARLRLRGRESEAEIMRRVSRPNGLRPDPPVTVIDNSGALADAADAFLAVLSGYVPAPIAGSRP